jgi:hypothetical protein
MVLGPLPGAVVAVQVALVVVIISGLPGGLDRGQCSFFGDPLPINDGRVSPMERKEQHQPGRCGDPVPGLVCLVALDAVSLL